jgi:hypothetical protein
VGSFTTRHDGLLRTLRGALVHDSIVNLVVR